MRDQLPRPLTFRYISALAVVAGLLLAGQLVVQRALDRQQDDARIVNLAGKQRMRSQRISMLLLAGKQPDAVAAEWEAGQDLLRRRDNSDVIADLFERIAGDHRAILAAARSNDAPAALAHEEAFLAGMDRIVAEYEREARAHVVTLRYIELVLFSLALLVLALEGAFVFRPAVRAVARYLAQRDRAETQLVTVSDREQQQLARDLHDGLCQELVGIAYLVKALRPTAPDEIDEIGRLLKNAIDQTRGLARGLHSHALDAEGLVAALHELAAQAHRLYGVTCTVRVSDDPEPTAEACTHLYRIAREAVINAAKHARATSVEIELTPDVLLIRDNGVGIASAVPGDGLGLHMMEYRAKMLGAALAVGTGVGGGTVVTCSLPIPA